MNEENMNSMNGKRVLITGGAGFIGSHVVDAFLAAGATVRVFFHYNGKRDTGVLTPEVLARVDKFYGSITDASAVRDAVYGSNVVVHMAALPGIPYSYDHPQEVWDVNAGGTLNVLNACLEQQHGQHPIERLVTTSTSEVYGSAENLPITEAHPLQPQSPYAASKVAADAMARSYYCSYGLPVVLARPFNTFGPRQSDRAVIPNVIKHALWSDKITVGALHPLRDFVFAEDAAEAFLSCATAGDEINGETLQFGTSNSWSVQQVIDSVQAITGTQVPVEVESRRMRPNQSEVLHLKADYSKATRLLGWKPKTTFSDGLRKTINYVSTNPERYPVAVYGV